MPHKRVIVTLVLMTVLATQTAPAWEEDVHHLLTFWLATQAGFSRADSDTIAQGTQSYDESSFLSAIGSVVWAVIGSDGGAAQSVRDRHFASDAPLPSPPQRRVVVPNSRFARKAAEASAQDRNAELLEFGQALHPLQDSWSHQGVPDVPFGVNSGYAFGHPASRGGWYSHDADYTHLHVEDAVATAQATYELMLDYLETHSRLRLRPSADWKQLEPIVRDFARAGSRARKDQWAVKHIGNVPEPVATLFDSREMHVVPRRVLLASTDLPTGIGSPAELVTAAQAFVNAWLYEQDVDRALQFVDLEPVRNSLEELGSPVTRSEAAEWFAKMLTMQLLNDHTLVSKLGHGDRRHPGYAALPVRPSGDKASLRAPIPVSVGGLSFQVQMVPLRHFLVLRDETLSHDEIGMEWHESGGKWLIARFIAIPM